MLQRSHSSELIVGRNIMTMESPFSEIRLHSVGGRVHKRESVGPLMAVNMAGLSGLHSALSVGRGNPRNKTLETLPVEYLQQNIRKCIKQIRPVNMKILGISVTILT